MCAEVCVRERERVCERERACECVCVCVCVCEVLVVQGDPRTLGAPSGFVSTEREFFIDNLLVRIHLIMEMVLVDRGAAPGQWCSSGAAPHCKERIFIDLMTSNRKLKASREGSK